MIIELEPNAFRTVVPLFDTLYIKFVINALVAGNCHGRIWVDDPTDPKSVFLWNKGPQYYVAGCADNKIFNDAIKQVIIHEIAPAPDSYMIVYYSSDAWADRLPDIFSERVLVKAPRYLYELDTLKIPDWHEHVPQGCQIVPINRQLLAETHLANLEQVTDEIKFMWPSIDLFFERAFGFCALHNDQIVCWCTGEYVYDNHIGIGIETVENYQHKGFATLTASAFAEHCISNNIKAHWDCWARNTPSSLTAEKVGFCKVADYTVFWGQID
ncbi:GNAT family N-acetyltransferase [bacterium]|nr:GNAT family N-acetyltransferase [bacterium]